MRSEMQELIGTGPTMRFSAYSQSEVETTQQLLLVAFPLCAIRAVSAALYGQLQSTGVSKDRDKPNHLFHELSRAPFVAKRGWRSHLIIPSIGGDAY